jgi:hypothetical protein
MKIRIAPGNPPREEQFLDWLLMIEREICRITHAESCESIDGAGGAEVGDRQTIVFVVDIPDLLPSMKRVLVDLGYSYCVGDSAVWHGFHVLQPPEPTIE